MAKTAKSIISSLLFCAIILITFLGIFQFGSVNGLSMENTYFHDDMLLVYKLNKASIDYNDVVIFWNDNLEENLVKRVIAVGGDSVQIKDDVVYVNGVVVPSFDIIKNPSSTHYTDMERKIIPQGFYFVMGDNRNNSTDSRSTIVGLVSRNKILGRVILDVTEKIGISYTAIKRLVLGLTILCIMLLVREAFKNKQKAELEENTFAELDGDVFIDLDEEPIVLQRDKDINT